jgi:biotin/methionine sulfoxide reductase
VVTDPYLPNSAHWGPFLAKEHDGVLDVLPHTLDPDPSPLLANIASATHHNSRVNEPVVRRSWLEHGPGPRPRTNDDEFVSVGWDRAIELVATELDRVRTVHGNSAIFGGSYGWSSAGRFHHAQSQVHRFLNQIGGYVRSVHSYSNGASTVILPHIAGAGQLVLRQGPTWEQIASNGELVVSFGGIPAKNLSVTPGGMTQHLSSSRIQQAAERGVEFDIFSPMRTDIPDGVTSRWHTPYPGTDVAVMLGLAHVLCEEGLADLAFLDKYCVGGEELVAYITGQADGIAKSPEWASSISGLPASDIVDLARRMAARRTVINVTWSLQRTQHGEQPIWMGLALAALLGQIGTPGGGFAHGLGSMGDSGEAMWPGATPSLPQGRNSVSSFIPVARVTDMLLNPGSRFEFNGGTHQYPDIKLAYWCGGNPFHHHQDLNRLRDGLGSLDTFIVHEPYWTSAARHADIVLPTTTTLERDDIGSGRKDTHLISMRKVVEPFGEARNDYDIFTDLASLLGVADEFTEGRSTSDWLEHLYDKWRSNQTEPGEVFGFAEFLEMGHVELPRPDRPSPVLFEAFRADPAAHPLGTPSGKFELFSETIASFDYDDCPGHPVWLEPEDYLLSPRAAQFPLHLIANQPATRLHGQHDMGELSQAAKIAGREAIGINRVDADGRGISPGDVVRVFNDRGSCLAGAVIRDDLMASVVHLPTGAWFDPRETSDGPPMCVHGNPNVLTTDRGTSRLAQACTGQHALVEVELWTDEVPPVLAHEPPRITKGLSQHLASC